ncbi:Oidioi.mRNA.OKI2018_I69.chr1.g2063.t1.cds [Oikopleura dioica]|uniref:Oidioi.mRNA.OKI2018_I69.chr1.g2063.t1.cds n=1 Tax=Oikopleura dioica TaxID=34765 RepID=A0ABN7SU43_OIKDI|nr:Oidioi.mRNA.OKI2018_I69.chr1.g2063.t1.cds [Oikopleura dioica]
MVKKCNPGKNEFRPLTFAEYAKYHKILGHEKASRMVVMPHGPMEIPFPDEKTHKIFLDQLDYAACDCCCSLCPHSSDEDEYDDGQETAKETAEKEEKPLDFNIFYSCFQYFYKNKTD